MHKKPAAPGLLDRPAAGPRVDGQTLAKDGLASLFPALAWWATAVVAVGAAGLAVAQSSPYYAGVSQSFGHESNMRRLSDAAQLEPGARRSDSVSTTSLLAGLDQPIGRQRLHADLALRSTVYASNEAFNNQNYALRLGVDWATINRLSGNLSANAGRSLSSFNLQSIGSLREKNFEDTRSLDASANMGLVTQYSLFATLGHREVDNTLQQDAVQARNFRQDSGSLGLRWQPSSGLAVGAALRSTQGRYPKWRALGPTPSDGYAADRFKRQDLDLTAQWVPSGLSTLDLRLSSGNTTYDLAQQRDFKGVTGSLNWAWQPTGKLRISTQLTRDTGQDSYATRRFDPRTNTFAAATADYSRVNDSLRVAADWAVTSKISVNSSLGFTERELVRSLPVGLGTSNDTGNESVRSLSLGARWAPTRAIQLSCNVGVDSTSGSGSQANNRVKNNSLNCFGQFLVN
jgi:hypothetical protein